MVPKFMDARLNQGITMVRAEDIPHTWTITLDAHAYFRLYKTKQFVKRLKQYTNGRKNKQIRVLSKSTC